MNNDNIELRQRADDSDDYRVYIAAKNRAAQRNNLTIHSANADEITYADSFGMNFTKGLLHDKTTGLVANRIDYQLFRQAILDGDIEPFHTLPTGIPEDDQRRLWEAPTAGFVFDTQGPDAAAVTMAPAPELGSHELTFELAEVYELACLRDVPFAEFTDPDAALGGDGFDKLQKSCERLNITRYARDGFDSRPRKTDANGSLTPSNVFRGSSYGVEVGPYLSCFMLMGNNIRSENDSSLQGLIAYGAQRIDQRVSKACPGINFMLTFKEWLNVQNGAKRSNHPDTDPKYYKPKPTFIHTPRDLATYVHFDALYQAYLNACLMLLSQGAQQGAQFDPSFQRLSGQFEGAKAGGFALFGGPHILSLVTEVATRALKAVRYQKFQVHRRLRPEALAGRINRVGKIENINPALGAHFNRMRQELDNTLAALQELPELAKAEFGLLPMAFAEGSPMHPAYGAGHATVAGACVTVLKAFFDTDQVLKRVDNDIRFAPRVDGDEADYVQVVTINDGSELTAVPAKVALTLEGELNKLAANIAIGRNMGGVHYFSDYYDSVRMGEKIAIGILQDQAEGYPKDAFTVSLTTFDGEKIVITRSDG